MLRNVVFSATVIGLACVIPTVALARDNGDRSTRDSSVSVRINFGSNGTYIRPHRRYAPGRNISPNYPAPRYYPEQRSYPAQTIYPTQRSYPAQIIYPTQRSYPAQIIYPTQRSYPAPRYYPEQRSYPAPRYYPEQRSYPAQRSYPVLRY